MDITLYASLSANGLMGTADNKHQPPNELLADFAKYAREAGALVIGRVTYEVMRGLGASLPGIGDLIVVSRTTHETPGALHADSPQAALDLLESRGHEAALIGGGAAIYSAFLAANLVHRLIVNILPVAQSGLAISPSLSTTPFQLVSHQRLFGDVVQLSYRRA